MKYRTRTYYTDAQKALMWERWKQGWTLHQIGQLFNRAHTSVQGILSRTGGFRPPQRSRSKIALTLAEREEISRAVAEGQSVRSIAARLDRAPSTVSREIKRNGGRANYRAAEADDAAWNRALRPKACKLSEDRALARTVTNGLLRQYLPKGIDISSYSQAKLNAVARQLNERPRKTLGYQTPAEMFSHTVASTG
jgi:IS30 family transposase